LRRAAVVTPRLRASLARFHWGPTQSLRVGQVCPHDLRARVYFQVVDRIQTDQKREQAVEALPESIRNDPQAIEAARAGVPIAVDKFPAGALLAQRGKPITSQQYQLSEAQRKAF